MQEVNYFAPSTIDECVTYLKSNPDTTIFAGGTDLLVSMEYKKIRPKSILNLKGIYDLDYLVEENGLIIGANTTISTIEENDYLKNAYPFLAKAASKLGSWQIRNTATVGGNICNAAPSAELSPPLIVLDSKVTIVGPKGERELPITEFFLGPGKTVLQEAEIVKSIQVPKLPDNAIGVYECHKWRKSMDVAIVNLAVLLFMDEDVIKDARVCLGAVAPTAFRAVETEKALIGNTLNDELIEKASEIASNEAKPISDVRAGAEYRRKLVKVYMKRALTSIQNGEV